MFTHHLLRAAFQALVLLAAGFILLTQAVQADDAKLAQAAAQPAKPKVALLAGGTDADLKALRETLEKVPAVKFKADEIKYSDFGRDGGMFTSFFTLEITDLTKTDIGAVAKAVAAAKTSKKPPALYLVIRYRPDSVKNDQFRAVLAKVKGVEADKSWAGDANLWVRVDDSGAGKLADVTRALHAAGIKIRDPITDTTDQP